MPKMMWRGKEVKWQGLDTVPYRDGILSHMIPRPGPRDGSNTFEMAVIEDSWEEPRSVKEFLAKPIDRGLKTWPCVVLFYCRLSFMFWGAISISWTPFLDWISAVIALVLTFPSALLLRYHLNPAQWLGPLGIYWEEATTVFEKSQVMRATMPFIMVGDDIMVVCIYTSLLHLRTSIFDWSGACMHPYMFCLAMVSCSLLRNLIWTHEQYSRKRVIRQGGELEYERIVRLSAYQLFEVSEPAMPGRSVSNSADLRWARSQMLRKGFQAELEFIFEILQEILREGDSDCSERLFERWHKLNVALCVQKDLIDLVGPQGKILVSGRRRQTLQKVKIHCNTEMGKLRGLVSNVAQGSSEASVVRALLEHQREQRTGSGAAQQRSRKVESQRRPTRRVSAANRLTEGRQHQAVSSYGPEQAAAGIMWNPDCCLARVSKHGSMKQCSNRPACDEQLCPQHALEATGADGLLHGLWLCSDASNTESRDASPNNVTDACVDESLEASHSDCVCCFDEKAIYVFQNCGHLIYCEVCLKWATAEGRRAKVLSRALLKCPLCRSESDVVHVDRFEGKLYS